MSTISFAHVHAAATTRLRPGALISRRNFRRKASQARASFAPSASFTNSALGERFGNQTS